MTRWDWERKRTAEAGASASMSMGVEMMRQRRRAESHRAKVIMSALAGVFIGLALSGLGAFF